MAKIMNGALAGAVSGSVGNTTFSHNRYGAYIRTRAIPVQPNSIYQQQARSRLSTASQAWAALDDDERELWRSWSAQHPVVDRLGMSQTLSGNAAFVMINALRAHCGNTQLDTPPMIAAPPGLLTCTLSADIGAGNFEIAYTATPLAANLKLFIQGALLLGDGKQYFKNALRFLGLSAAAQASPFSVQTLFSDRLGTLVVGQRAVVYVAVYDSTSGLLSQPLASAADVVTT
jgi:hypothetical protein